MAEFSERHAEMIEQMHGALVGTIDKSGLIHVVETHVLHPDPGDAVAAHLSSVLHVDERNGTGWNWRRWAFDISKSIATLIVLAAIGWMIVGARADFVRMGP